MSLHSKTEYPFELLPLPLYLTQQILLLLPLPLIWSQVAEAAVSAETSPEHLIWEATRGHAEQVSKPPGLTPLDAEVQRRYPKLLPGD